MIHTARMTIRQSISHLVRKNRLGADLLALRHLATQSHLRECGWFESRTKQMAVDAAGEPLPWYTYAAIAFLQPRVRLDMRVFEYGSGNSTLWWARRVARVETCEHDPAWFDRVRASPASNVHYELAALPPEGDYPHRVARFQNTFDAVLIDGRNRVQCARSSVTALKPDGIVVWDNTDRAEYQPGFDFLGDHGFRRLDFWGMGPINAHGSCTSIFYRQDNCLGI